MKSIVICEGKTDADFLQYYLRTVYNWEDYREPQEGDFKVSGKSFARILKRGADILRLVAVNGCSKIIPALSEVFEYNKLERLPNSFEKIVFVTDNDEENSVESVVKSLTETIDSNSMMLNSEIVNTEWAFVSYLNRVGEKGQIKVLPMIIPFGETGAIESFLLKAVSEKDTYDKNIIEKGKLYVNDADPEARYMRKRRHKTKAEYEVFFAIRTTEGQYNERGNILKNIPWEEYEYIQKAFKEFGNI